MREITQRHFSRSIDDPATTLCYEGCEVAPRNARRRDAWMIVTEAAAKPARKILPDDLRPTFQELKETVTNLPPD